jgi:hypothetical protein
MIANADDDKYGALLATVRPGVITNDTERERLTEEEKLLVLLTRLIEDYEQKREPMDDAALEAA